MPVNVTGPDGKTYHFPDGTTKEQAVAYFKQQGHTSHGAGGSWEPEAGPVKRFTSKFAEQYKGALLNPMGIGSDTGAPVQTDPKTGRLLTSFEDIKKQPPDPAMRGATFKGMGEDIADFGRSLVPVEEIAAGDYAGAAGKAAANVLMLLSGKRSAKGISEPQTQTLYEAAKKANPADLPESVQKFIRGDDSAKSQAYSDLLKWSRDNVEVTKKTVTAPAKQEAPRDSLLRKGAQKMSGLDEKLTEKAVTEANEKYAADTEKVNEANATKAEAHADKVSDIEARNKEKARKHAKEVIRVKKMNADARDQVSRRGALARGTKVLSERLGDGITKLEKDTRRIANGKYDEVKARIGTETVPADPLVAAVKEAEGKYLRGTESASSIAQFRSLLARENQGPQTLMVDGREIMPSDPGYENLRQAYGQEGLLGEEGKPLSFSDLQGYYSELGDKLSKGNLPGDVYQAAKHVQNAVAEQMQGMAKNAGVLPQFKAAQAYYRQFMETFHEPSGPSHSGSPVAQSLNAADPDYMAGPFLGESGSRGIEMLAKYSPELARLASYVRDSYEEMKSLPEGKLNTEGKRVAEQNELPAKPKPRAIPEAPEPKPGPEAPTVDPQQIKREKVAKLSENIRSFTKYDAAVIASSVVGPFLGHWWTLLAEPLNLGARKGIGIAMENPKVVEWLSKPSQADFEALKKLPVEAQAEVAQNMQKFIAENQRKAGKPLNIDPELQKWLYLGYTTGAAQNDRKKLLERGKSLAGATQ